MIAAQRPAGREGEHLDTVHANAGEPGSPAEYHRRTERSVPYFPSASK